MLCIRRYINEVRFTLAYIFRYCTLGTLWRIPSALRHFVGTFCRHDKYCKRCRECHRQQLPSALFLLDFPVVREGVDQSVQEQVSQEALSQACQYEEDGSELYVEPLCGQPVVGVVAIFGVRSQRISHMT